MSWKNLKIGTKLGVGFGSLLLLIVIAGFVGYRGLKSVDHSLAVVGDEQVPIIDAANNMRISLMAGVTNLDQFQAATTALATDDQSQLAEVEKAYRQTLADFDNSGKAILSGGTLNGGIKVIKTDNPKLAELIRQADELRSNRYQPAATKMMAEVRELLARKAASTAAMGAMDGTFDTVTDEVGGMEEILRDEIASRTKAGKIGAEAKSILREEVPLSNMVDEVKYTLAMTRISLEDFVGVRDPADLDKIEAKYKYWVADFDKVVAAILEGGTVDGVKVVATGNPKLRAAVQEANRKHKAFQQEAENMMTAHRSAIAQAKTAEAAQVEADSASEAASALISKVEALSDQEMATAKLRGQESSSQAITWQLAVVCCSLLIGGLLGVIITRAITRPLAKGVAFAEALALGDFSAEIDIDQQDEIGILAKSFQNMKATMGKVLQEMGTLTEKIQNGALSSRGNATAFSGSWQEMIQGTNNVVDAFMEPLEVTLDYLDRIARGDLPEPIQETYRGDFDGIRNNLNDLIKSMEEVTSLASEIALGNLELEVKERSAEDRLMRSLNEMIQSLKNISDLSSEIAGGNLMVDFTERSKKIVCSSTLKPWWKACAMS